MKNLLLCVFLCLCSCAVSHAQPQSESIGSDVAKTLEIIRNAKKTIYVQTSGNVSQPVVTELAIRRHFKAKGERAVKVEIMTDNATPFKRFAKVWVNKKYAATPEVLIVDKSIVISNFNSEGNQEIVKDPVLAAHRISDLKKNRKASEKIKSQKNHSGIDHRGVHPMNVLLRSLLPQ